MCDIHNTLVNTILRKYATTAIKDKYLPRLSADTVSFFSGTIYHEYYH